MGEHGVPFMGEHGVPVMGEHRVPVKSEHGVPFMGEHGVVVIGEHGVPVMGEHGVLRVDEHEILPDLPIKKEYQPQTSPILQARVSTEYQVCNQRASACIHIVQHRDLHEGRGVGTTIKAVTGRRGETP